MLAIDVDCQRCGAKAGFGCITPTGNIAAFHSPRWKAAGIAKPTPEQRIECYEKERALNSERIRRNYERLLKTLMEENPCQQQPQSST